MSSIIKTCIKEEPICRLCLKVAKVEFEIDDIVKQMFEILLLKLDLDIARDPIICQDCMEVSKKCLNFKSTCIDTEEIILSYPADRKSGKHNIKVIYKEREGVQAVFDEDFNICRFCITRLEANNFSSLDALMDESMVEMLSEYMADTDFTTIENPVICTNCKENLDGYFKFVLNCLNMEEKIKMYCKEKGTDNMGQVKLSNVLRFMFADILEYPDKCSQTCKIEQEHTEGVYPELYVRLIKQEEVDIKDEEMILSGNSYKNPSEFNSYKNGGTFSPNEYGKETKSVFKKSEFNIEWPSYQNNFQGNITEKCSLDGDVLEVRRNEISDMEINKHAMCTDATKQSAYGKSELTNDSDTSEADMYKHKVNKSEIEQGCVLKNNSSTYKAASEPKHKVIKHKLTLKDTLDLGSNISIDRNICPMYKCSLCTYETKHNGVLNRHMLVHMNKSKIKIYKCSLCAYVTKLKGNLTRHMLVHKARVPKIKTYKCSLCVYASDHKGNLDRHMLVHKDVSEIEMYQCFLCAFETKLKDTLIKHMLVHKDASEVKMYKCSLCAYETKHKGTLTVHMWVHKGIPETKIFKCALCDHQTRRRGNFNKHMLVHKDVSQIKMYKCSLCAYEAKRKGCLKKHMLIHKDVSEIKMYKCPLCSFETRHNNLNSHMLVHKDVSEIKMYKCPLCAYETKYKSSLTTHMLNHKDISEIKRYKCSLCTFNSNHRGNLNQHMLLHKDVSEIDMYKCSLCTYKSKHKNGLRKHMVVHKDVSEIDMYKCSLCTFKSKYKNALNNHMLVHKDVSEIDMYECALCTYKAKQKSSLKVHMLVHMDVSKIKMHKCSLCHFQTKRKGVLNKHSTSVHRDIL